MTQVKLSGSLGKLVSRQPTLVLLRQHLLYEEVCYLDGNGVELTLFLSGVTSCNTHCVL